MKSAITVAILLGLTQAAFAQGKVINCAESAKDIIETSNFLVAAVGDGFSVEFTLRNISGHQIDELDASLWVNDWLGGNQVVADLDDNAPWPNDESKQFSYVLGMEAQRPTVVNVCIDTFKLAKD